MDKSGEIQQDQENVTGVAPCDSQMAYSHNQNDPLVASGTSSVAVPTPAQPLAAFSNSIDQLVACGTPSVAAPTPTQPPAGFSNSIDQLVASGTPSVAVPTPTQPPAVFSNSIDQLAYRQAQHFHKQQQQQQQDFHHQLPQQQHYGQQLQQQQDFQQPLQQQLKVFWENQMQEIVQTDCFSKHSFPLNRIKKIMKMDEDVLQVSADAPVLFAKACEMFILDLTSRSWFQAKEIKRSTLQKNHVAAVIASNFAFNFLVDIIPKDELKEEEGPGIAQSTIPIEEGLGISQSTIPIEEQLGFAQSTIPITSPAADLPYNDVPPQHPVGSTGMIMGNPVDQAALYSTLQPNPNPPPAQQQSTIVHSTKLPRPPV